MTAFALASRTAQRYKARALLAVSGVAIIGALNFDMLLLSHGLLLSFADMINSTGFDVRVVGSAGLPITRLPVTGASRVVDELGRLPEVERAALVRGQAAVAIVADRRSIGINLVGTTEASGAGAWTLVRGANLDAGSETTRPTHPPIVVSRALASLVGLEPGSTLRVRVRPSGGPSALPTIEFRVVGIADFRFDASNEYTVATTLDGFQMGEGGTARDEADMVLVASTPEAGADAAVAAITRRRPDLHAISNEQAIAQFNRNGFTYFRQISLVLSTTTAVFTFLLVATLLTVSVNQRLGEVAALRALGISRRRIAAMLLWESALLVGAGGLLALPLGAALAQLLDRILRQMPGLPQGLHFFVFEPQALVLQTALLVATAVVAALYPMWLAVSLPIAQTLRQETVS